MSENPTDYEADAGDGAPDDADETGYSFDAMLADMTAEPGADDTPPLAPRPRWRVTSDGDVFGTHVYDVETGADMTAGIRRIEFIHEVGELPLVRLTMTAAIVDVTGLQDRWRVRNLVDRPEEEPDVNTLPY